VSETVKFHVPGLLVMAEQAAEKFTAMGEVAPLIRGLAAALATAQRERAEWEANAQRENAALVQAQEIIAKLEAREWEVRCCAANVLLAFEDWPEYQTETADGERRTALDSLAVLLAKAKGDTP